MDKKIVNIILYGTEYGDIEITHLNFDSLQVEIKHVCKEKPNPEKKWKNSSFVEIKEQLRKIQHDNSKKTWK